MFRHFRRNSIGPNRILTRFICILSILTLSGCAELAFYHQAAMGQWQLLSDRRPLQAVIEDPSTPAPWREALERIPPLRQFAASELALPVGESYSTFVDLGRPYVLWNLLAAPPDEVRLKQWCYPIVGCQSYRGYFERADAEAHARALEAQGYQTWTPGIIAYSTLGWFDDPVLSSFMRLTPNQRAALLFHELAHKVVYVDGDTRFNESYATAVEIEGLNAWLKHIGAPPERFHRARLRREMEATFVELVLAAGKELQAFYDRARAEDLPLEPGRRAILDKLRQRYRQARKTWSLPSPYDRFFEGPITNAHIASVGQYHQWVPAFRQLLKEEDHDFARFHQRVRVLADRGREQREALLERLNRLFRKNTPAK